MSLRNTFGKNLKYYRFQNNYTQEKLAEKLNISITYLSELERGMHSMDFDKIEKLCISLNIEPFQLFLQPKDINLPKRIDMEKSN